MFGNVVQEIKKAEFEEIFDAKKKQRKVKLDTELNEGALKEVIAEYKKLVKKHTKRDFPQDPREQLVMARDAVFRSWNNDRAQHYRRINNISDDLGTAVNVQAMVFGNLGETSGTGVGFTRNPAIGTKEFYGEFLLNAQGEDVVSGVRTPVHILELEKIMTRSTTSCEISPPGSRSITKTCRISSSPSRMASSTCCRRVTESVPA
jgi:pyruvate,orthophosphate dikinase